MATATKKKDDTATDETVDNDLFVQPSHTGEVADRVPENPPEVEASKAGLSPASPFTPTVAIPEDAFSGEVRKGLETALKAVVKAEEQAHEAYNQEAIVALRTVRRNLSGLLG